MMHEFLTDNRTELINRCREKVDHRASSLKGEKAVEHYGVSLFLDQLIKTLRVEQTSEPEQSRKVSGPEDGTKALSEIGETAACHGRELLEHGLSIDQVVHDYGDLCQAITDLACEMKVPLSTDEFRTLNRCLDNGIAIAATEFSYQHDFIVADAQTRLLNGRLGYFAHELRNLLNSATLALSAIKAGTVGPGGATGAVLDRSLVGMRNLIDRSLSEVRVTAGLPANHRLFSLADFIAEAKLSGSLEAQVKKCVLAVSSVDSGLALEADRDLLLSALGNLLQNAFDSTRQGTEVSLNAYAVADRILIDVEDNCGGLEPGAAERMFPLAQNSEEDPSVTRPGLSIARRSVEINEGNLAVRDMPNKGCVFTIDLPRHGMHEAVASGKN